MLAAAVGRLRVAAQTVRDVRADPDSGDSAETDAVTDLLAAVDAVNRLVTQPATSPPGPPTERALPGWYRDPWKPDALRYWDGRAWTPRTRELEPVTITTYRPMDPGKGLLLTLITGGLYAPVWALRSAERHKVRRQ